LTRWARGYSQSVDACQSAAPAAIDGIGESCWHDELILAAVIAGRKCMKNVGMELQAGLFRHEYSNFATCIACRPVPNAI